MSIKLHVNPIEGEEVARQVDPNRECTRIGAKFWERDRLGRRGSCLATRSGQKDEDRDVFVETPNTATERSEQHKSGPLCGLVALPKHRISEHSRLFASIRGSIPNSLISKTGLTQVVDFHDSFRYFSALLRRLGDLSVYHAL